jgi:hypothetical protein
MEAKDKLVPEQETGKAIEASANAVLNTPEEAKLLFEIAKTRLQNVNEWHKTAKNISAEFRLVTNEGTLLNRRPQQGDYFKIDIPGPGTKTGNGYDWVQIEEIVTTDEGDMESYGFRVRPSQNPEERNADIAHFYSSESTSTFLVTRKGNTVTAEVFDRNTKPNENVDSVGDKIRDAAVGAAGLIGFSKLQWNGLTEGLIAP